jgi:hypothetical protein
MADNPGQPTLGQHGGKRTKGRQGNDPSLRMRGNSREYLLARLRREGYHDLLTAVLNRKISAFSAACLLGWARRPPTVRGSRSPQAHRREFNAKALIG